MATMPFKVIQGHQFWYISKASNLYDLLLLINNNLPPILQHFQVIANYVSNFR